MDINSYILYLVVAFFYISSPGLAVFLTIQYAAIYNYKKILFLILGNISGLGILAFISAIGIGIIISSSIFLTNVIKFIGALVLLYLGVKMILNASKSKIAKKSTTIHDNDFSYYKEGLLLAVTNPKPIIFFTSIYPQFIQDNDTKSLQFFILASTFMFISFCTLHVYAFISKNTIGKVLNNNRLKVFNTVSGSALILTGIFIVIF